MAKFQLEGRFIVGAYEPPKSDDDFSGYYYLDLIPYGHWACLHTKVIRIVTDSAEQAQKIANALNAVDITVEDPDFVEPWRAVLQTPQGD